MTTKKIVVGVLAALLSLGAFTATASACEGGARIGRVERRVERRERRIERREARRIRRIERRHERRWK